MDNFHIDVTARGSAALQSCLEIALMSECYASHWCDHPVKGLVLFWSKPDVTVKYVLMDRLPIKVDKLEYDRCRWNIGDIVESHGSLYVWLPHQDDGGDPQSWRWEYLLDSHLARTVDVHPFPYKMKHAADLAKFVEGWLGELPTSRYGPELDHDGHNTKGFRVYNDRWGRVDDCGSYSFVAIKPEWAWHGK